jgi:hypothetical protein
VQVWIVNEDACLQFGFLPQVLPANKANEVEEGEIGDEAMGLFLNVEKQGPTGGQLVNGLPYDGGTCARLVHPE